jgi:hypothetical protein
MTAWPSGFAGWWTSLSKARPEIARQVRADPSAGSARSPSIQRLTHSRASIRAVAASPRCKRSGELGDLELAAGNREEAVLHYQAALDPAKKRIEVRPQDMQARREPADTYERLGHLYELSREWAVASEWHGKSLGVWRTWTEYGISSVYNERREEEAAAAVLLVRAKQVAAARNERKADE